MLARRGRPDWRELLIRWLHLALLSALAIAQPLFDLLGKNAEFFAARGSTGGEIAVFAVALVLVPPLVLLALELVAGLAGRRAQHVLHLAFVSLLVALFAMQFLKREIGFSSAVAIFAGAAIAGGLVAVLYARLKDVRSILTWLSPAVLLFLALFLFGSPVSKVVFEHDAKASERVASRTPVVMIVFDEFSVTSLMDRHERIDPVLYPNFTRLAHDATWFRRATAPDDMTTSATPALLTGSLPRKGKLPIPSDYPHNLFSFLGGSYRMRVSEEATSMCPPKQCAGGAARGSFAKRERSLINDLGLVYLHVVAPPSVEDSLASVSETWGDFGGGDSDAKVSTPAPSPAGGATKRPNVLHELGGGRPARFEQWVDSIDGSSTPTLYFKHVLLPHVPFQYLPSGRRYRTSPHEAVPGLVGANSWGNEWLREQAYQRHLLQVGFADRLLGTAIDRLKQTGLYDKALIVVTADNGESFLHDANRHVVSEKNIEDVAPPPLFIKAPDQHAGRIVDRHVRTIDVLPSMAALLHVRLPWRVQGQSAYSPRARIPQGVQVFERSGKVLNVSLAELKARMHQSLERKLRLFGSDGHGPGLYGIGPHHELVGRPLGELHVTESHSLTARINDAGKLGTVDPSSDFLPSHITGRIVGEGAPHQRDVAVAVNGRVAAVSRTFSLRGSRTENFSQLVPESVLHAGRNRVEIFLVTRDASGLRLERVAATG